MKVKVMFFGRARDIVGEDKGFVELELDEEATLNDLLDKIAKEVSEKFTRKFRNKSIILMTVVNGVSINDLNYKLSDGDAVAFVPPSQGG